MKGHLLKYILPFTYFAKTRLSIRSFVYHGIIEWAPMIFLTIYYCPNYSELLNLLLGYLLFISIYELGYVFNDLVSVKDEPNARKRFKYKVSNLEIAFFALIRASFFISLLIIFPSKNPEIFIWGISLMSILFIAHNVLSNPSYKTLTFIGLAYLRFNIPLLFFLPLENLQILVGPILLLYLIPRFLTYLDSKNLLILKERKSIKFKLAQVLYVFPISIFWALSTADPIHVYWNTYLVVIFLILLLIERLRKKPYPNF